MSAISKLNIATNAHIIAKVTHASEGQASLLQLSNDQIVEVSGHGSSVPVLNKGDSVIAVTAGDEYFIIDRLRNSDEKPSISNHDGNLVFESDQFIGLKVKESSFRITEQGELVLAAQEITSLAQELNVVKGKLVKIN